MGSREEKKKKIKKTRRKVVGGRGGASFKGNNGAKMMMFERGERGYEGVCMIEKWANEEKGKDSARVNPEIP